MASSKDDPYGGMIFIGALLLAGAVISFGRGIIKKQFTEVAVSNRRVLIKTGLISRKTSEVILAKVESVGVAESALGRMLGYGDVIVRDTGGTTESFCSNCKPWRTKPSSSRAAGQC